MNTFFELLNAGGFTLYVLLVCSLVVWAIIFEWLWRSRRLVRDSHTFHLQAMNVLLRRDVRALEDLCQANPLLPGAILLKVALERLRSSDARLKAHWAQAVERQRMLVNQQLRRNLWVLGTIGSAAPFIGLFGTVVGILRSFQDIASTGKGGFAVVAAGISEALIATAAGIIVAVVAVMAYNAFQTRWAGLVLSIRLQTEEWTEILSDSQEWSGASHGA